jgi:quercetin dioxygenase-like cupin family protein
MPGPTVPFQGTYPITVQAGDYDLLYLVLDFAPGAGIPLHYHGGPATVVGMEGELTLHPEGGAEKKLKPGDVVNEMAGMKHVMINTGNANARILATILLPKGAQVTTVVATDGGTQPGPTVPFQGSYPITVTEGEYELVNLVLDFGPGAGIPLHYHGGPAVVVGMEGQLTLRPEGKAERKLDPGGVVNEMAGMKHVMINTGNANARILAGVLLPKGAELTTVVANTTEASANASESMAPPAGMPSTGTANVDSVVFWAVFFSLLLVGLGVMSRRSRTDNRS